MAGDLRSQLIETADNARHDFLCKLIECSQDITTHETTRVVVDALLPRIEAYAVEREKAMRERCAKAVEAESPTRAQANQALSLEPGRMGCGRSCCAGGRRRNTRTKRANAMSRNHECDGCGLASCDLPDGVDPELIFEYDDKRAGWFCQGCMASWLTP